MRTWCADDAAPPATAGPKIGKIVANSAVGFSGSTGSTGMMLLAAAATFLVGRYLTAKS